MTDQSACTVKHVPSDKSVTVMLKCKLYHIQSYYKANTILFTFHLQCHMTSMMGIHQQWLKHNVLHSFLPPHHSLWQLCNAVCIFPYVHLELEHTWMSRTATVEVCVDFHVCGGSKCLMRGSWVSCSVRLHCWNEKYVF